VQLPTTYPKTIPILKVEGYNCGNPKVPEMVQGVLDSKPQELLGNEMIYEIASQIQDILEDAATAKAKKEGLSSLEAERELQRNNVELELKEHEEVQKRQQEEAIAEEDTYLVEQINREITKRESKARAVEKTLAPRRGSRFAAEGIETTAHTMLTLTFPRTMNAADKGGDSFSFSSVIHLPPMLTTPAKRLSLVIPQTEKRFNPPTLLLKDIYLREARSEGVSFRRKMTDIEELLKELTKLRHVNVVDLLGFKVDRTSIEPNGGAASSVEWELSIVTEYAQRGSLSDMLEASGIFEPAFIRSYTKQILNALEFFDQHGYVHPAVHLNNILIFPSRTGKPTVKLSDGYGLALKEMVTKSRSRADFTSSELPQWTAPELNEKIPRRSNKSCIWELGRVVLEMVHGKRAVQEYTSPQNYLNENEDYHYETFRAFLVDIFQLDVKKRSKAFELLSFQMMQEDESKPLFRIGASNESARATRVEDGSASSMVPSRFKHDFENDMSVLGKGGYGKVFKAKHRLDGRFYAVKEVVSDSPEELREILRETILLSRLNHPYVVRYFSAWMETEKSGSSGVQSSRRSNISSHSTGDGDMNGISTSSDIQDDVLDFSIPHDMMSTSGFKDIVFGYDGDEDDQLKNADSSDDPSSNAVSSSPENPASPQAHRRKAAGEFHSAGTIDLVRTKLYIQMEFCENRTLRHLINENSLSSVDKGWRIFRQILDGLSHVHKVGIIHRDLKPENIFMDNDNNPRIGDFGLATSGTFASVVRVSEATQTTDHGTRNIGTTFYVAPELSSNAKGQYTSKVDMYSLGIIFFEICYPRMLGQERVHELDKIRQNDHRLPAMFRDPEYAVQGEVIMMLLTHRPRERPSAAELFRSGKIPEPVEDEKLRKFVAGMAESGSPQYHKLVSSLFAQKPNRVQEYAWHRHAWNPPSADLLLMSNMVRDKLTSIFRRHGAVEIKRKLLFPRSEHYKTAASLLGTNGTPLQLAYDLTLPNALALSHEHAPFEKIFTFGNVYRESLLGGEPKEIGEIDFDIVSYTTSDLSLKEAEAIKVLDEVIQECPPLKSSMLCFHLNHSDLLNLVLDFCKISPSQEVGVKEAISRLNTGNGTWEMIRNELQASTNISSASLEDLMRFNFRGDLNNVRQKIEAIFGNSDHLDRLGSIFTRIEAVVTYLHRLQIKTKLYIHPLSSYNEKFYRGSILFQCLLEGRRKSLLAVGGRYDALIAEHAIPTSLEKPRAIGFHLPWDEFNSLMVPDQKRTAKKFLKTEAIDSGSKWRPNRCDVLVTSFDPSILRTTGVELVQQLWASGLSAELSKDFASMEELMIAYKSDHHGWVVLVRHDSSSVGERALKIRNIAKKEDAEVNVTEVAGWLLSEIRERDHREVQPTQPIPRLRRGASHGDTLGDGREPEVRILATQHRGKKQNRHAIVDAAASRTRELTDSFLADAPVAAIETSDEILEAIRATRLGDLESWRTVIQSAPLQERKYLQQVLDLLQDMAESGKRGAFVFNYRTRGCIYYDLGTQK
jgi:eukaryotic translation initiation factor 2-alpha kinase 4